MPAHSQEYIAAKKAEGHGMANLNDMAMWATITTANANGNGYQTDRDGRKVLTLVGQTKAGLSAATEKPGALSPEFCCWLMGFPEGWARLSHTEMPSSRKSRKKSGAR